jgi:hypothetical protein
MFITEISFYLFAQSLFVDMMLLSCKQVRAPINSIKDLAYMFIN